MSRTVIIQDNVLKSDFNIKILKVLEEYKIFRIIGKLTYRLTTCSYCHQHSMVKNGYKTVYIRDIPFNNKSVIIKLAKQRFLCCACHHSIIAKLVTDTSVENIAQDLNLSLNTINKQITKIHNEFIHPSGNLPEHLSFDEVRTANHQMSFLAINAENGNIISLLPNRISKNIIDHFKRCYSLSSRKAVKSVVLDFNSSYHIFIKRLFPNAQIIANRFHLIQMLNRVTIQVRIATMYQFQWNSREYRLLKYYWRLYLKPFNQLESKNPTWKSHLKDRLTSEQVISEGISTNSGFSEVYFAAQSIADAIRHQDKEKLLQPFRTKTTNPYLRTLLNTFKTRIKSIVHALYSLLSNGRIEGTIRKIKQIQRTTYGYRNWQYLRDCIYIEFIFKTKKRKLIRK
ncbi:transposase [Pediococcus acidilactici NGRI 0510Q]|nr:ISL3 family transposase [Pediococcus acidilactici]GAC46244.1 transposase [Pediococcus acidilactici NGRI 0510Q]KRN91917.1 transposase [Pediococcus acidilactici]NBI14444.1 ISL3 family transposase [Pediococcus acidilactici]NFB08615.1 ISL3 family transposase [Pediococcus acidilactici]QIO85261.1 ISL3 family transposase [Pediococcus acidilactici]